MKMKDSFHQMSVPHHFLHLLLIMVIIIQNLKSPQFANMIMIQPQEPNNNSINKEQLSLMQLIKEKNPSNQSAWIFANTNQ